MDSLFRVSSDPDPKLDKEVGRIQRVLGLIYSVRSLLLSSSSLLFFSCLRLRLHFRSVQPLSSLLFATLLADILSLGVVADFNLFSSLSTSIYRCWSTKERKFQFQKLSLPRSLVDRHHQSTNLTHQTQPTPNHTLIPTPNTTIQNGRQPLRPQTSRHIQSRPQHRRLRHPRDPPPHPLGRLHIRDVHDHVDVHVG